MPKEILKWAGVFFGIIAVVFVLELVGLGFFKFFEPKRENIRREVFENTKSYTHGKIQDLAKYYKEYTEGKDKGAIKAVIQIQFAEFDETRIVNTKLRTFLINMRGF